MHLIKVYDGNFYYFENKKQVIYDILIKLKNIFYFVVMDEIKEDSFYALYKEKYAACILDYVILKNDAEYEGAYSHKKAVISAFSLLNKRLEEDWKILVKEYPKFTSKLDEYILSFDPDKIVCEKKYTVKDFFSLSPDENYGWEKVGKGVKFFLGFSESPVGNVSENSVLVRFFGNAAWDGL